MAIHMLLCHISIAYLLAFAPITIVEIGTDAIVAAKSIIVPYHLNNSCTMPRLLAAWASTAAKGAMLQGR